VEKLSVQELAKQAAEYGSSMDAMQLSLDEIRQQCTDKDAKLDQLSMMLEQYKKQEVKLCLLSELNGTELISSLSS